MDNKFDVLKLDNQLCFPLYVCSKEIVKRYKPFLDEIDLTYTQYIVMMALWEQKEINVKYLGELLYLDSGTLTPLLKKLEQKGYIERNRDLTDERNVNISLTKTGFELREKACEIPIKMAKCINLEQSEGEQLWSLLNKLMIDLR